MTYLLDTNTRVVHLRSGGNHPVSTRVGANWGEIALSSVVAAELLFGARRSRNVAANLTAVRTFCAGFAILPFDAATAETHALTRAELVARGTPIGPYDSMIAATALVHGLIVVTNNMGEFIRVPGLRVEDWLAVP